jgi:ABC-2 type transport system ATP-binding protein
MAVQEVPGQQAPSQTSADPVVVVRGLSMRYGPVEAVRGIDLDVMRGEIFAFLGPNGAGKTTTVEILEGYRHRTGGEVSVLGVDPARADAAWRERVGVVLQSGQVEPELTVRETVEFYAGLYEDPRDVDDVLALVGLGAQADVRNERLSGGQHRRLDVALALVGNPELLFLDEPTTGFDPAARRAAWKVIADLRTLGATIFLTTHYLEEAEALADRIAIIVDGRIVAEGTPDSLGGRDQTEVEVVVHFAQEISNDDLPPVLSGRAVVVGGRRVRLLSNAAIHDVHAMTSWVLESGVAATGIEIKRATLEDVYLRLTGQEERP